MWLATFALSCHGFDLHINTAFMECSCERGNEDGRENNANVRPSNKLLVGRVLIDIRAINIERNDTGCGDHLGGGYRST